MEDEPDFSDVIHKVKNWLLDKFDSLEPEKITQTILSHYKKDKTFSVPILVMCTLSGRLGEKGWKYVPQLPYQLAVLPDRFFKWLNLSMVSYAITALIAMGLIRQQNYLSKNPFILVLNKIINPVVLKVLSEKQPHHGGFLEAAPLTGFVLMSMVWANKKDHEVCAKAEKFLQNSIRKDGSLAN